MKKTISTIGVIVLLNGCASMEKSIILGAGTGGALGSGVGLAAERSAGSTLIGLGIGALVGGVVGFAIHKDQEAKRGEFLAPAIAKDFKDKIPQLSNPEVRRVWVPAKIEGNRYIEGHFLYVIDRPSVWGK